LLAIRTLFIGWMPGIRSPSARGSAKNASSCRSCVLLALNRPGEATDTIRRAQAQLPGLEDDRVAVQVLLMSARIQIARGQLRDATASLDRIRALGVGESDPPFLELLLRLALARGDTAQAAALARGGAAAKDVGDGLMLAAVQAAVRVGDVPLARAWLASAS